MTPAERRLILVAARALKSADDANPDVGMGPLKWMFVEDACEAAGIEVTHAEALDIAKDM